MTGSDEAPTWAHHPAEDVLRRLGSRAGGLTEPEVAAARERFGANALPEARTSWLTVLAHQFQDVLVYVLLGALALSIVAPLLEGGPLDFEGFLDAIVIAAILVLNAVLGFTQEFQAERAIAALEKLSAPRSQVLRGGQHVEVASEDLVPGDVLLLEAGARIAADARVLTASWLEVDESSLTGESVPVEKSTQAVDADTPLAEHVGMVHAGTLVTRGSGRGVVVATGLQTEAGRIAGLMAAADRPETPLQIRLAQLGRNLGVLVLVLCVAVVGLGLLRGMHLMELLLIAVSLAVSAVPEGLPAVVTVCFALGVRRMAKRNALVRRLDSLETLGQVTVICSDKTGTITKNQMTVVAAWGEQAAMAEVVASCNHADEAGGEPTEVALLRWAESLGVPRLDIDAEEVPFTSAGKYMQTRHGDRSFLKGSLERLIDLGAGGPVDEAAEQAAAMQERGLRVLAAAVADPELRLLGIVGIEDPPRDGVAEAVAQAAAAGIRTVMITGDAPGTASAIAGEIGLPPEAVTGRELDALDDAGLQAAALSTSVFARVSPENKVELCRALQAAGHVVAMTGDGVNDAPALQQAHVGVAMGDRGTDVAREAGAIVLADDHYATIVRAIAEGRRIHDNIRRFVLFLLRANFDELLLILTSVLMGLPLPYLPIHILWINLMTDSLPALALGVEAAEPDVMERPPRSPTHGLLHGEWPRLFGSAVLAFALTLAFYLWQLERTDLPHARTATLTMAICFELLLALSARSRRPVISIGLFGNRWLLGAMGFVALLHVGLVHGPLAKAFHLVPISLADWGLAAAVALVGFVILELTKLGRKQP